MNLLNVFRKDYASAARNITNLVCSRVLSYFQVWKGSIITVNGVRLKIDRRLSPLMASILRSGHHSMPEIAMVLEDLEKDDVVMELGGGVGYTSTRVAKKIGSDRVYTFEANPELRSLMEENFRLNDVRPTAETCMMGHKAGSAEFTVARHFWSSTNVPGFTAGRTIQVPVLSLNEKIREINPTFLYMDIEGGERELFDGLDYHHITKIMLETHPHIIGDEETNRVLTQIQKAGFEINRTIENCYLFKRNRLGGNLETTGREKNQPVGDGISVDRNKWRFDGDVPGRFDRHVERSIPGYFTGHEIVVKLARHRLSKEGVCYDLGCATGTLTAQLAACADPRTTLIVGLDQVPGMLAIARERCTPYANVSIEQADITAYDFLPSCVIVSYYTLQFVPVTMRPGLVKRIFNALEDGGIFLLFEKICFADPVTDKKVNDDYHAFKKSQGFSDEEIISKAESLKGILVPQTESQNLEMLKAAGFSKIKGIFKELCWQGYLAQK